MFVLIVLLILGYPCVGFLFHRRIIHCIQEENCGVESIYIEFCFVYILFFLYVLLFFNVFVGAMSLSVVFNSRQLVRRLSSWTSDSLEFCRFIMLLCQSLLVVPLSTLGTRVGIWKLVREF